MPKVPHPREDHREVVAVGDLDRHLVLLIQEYGAWIYLILFVIVSLDDPLRGEQGIGPDALVLLWERQMVWDEGPAWSLAGGAGG